MRSFQDFYRQLLNKASQSTVLSIKGRKKTIKAMVRLTSKNYLSYGKDGEYVKVFFADGSFLLLVPADQECYYADKIVRHVREIPDNVIGKKKELTYKGKTYRLDNANDYQYVLQVHVGSPEECEGEVKFSDYMPVTGPKEFLSLGWSMRTGKRDDINPQIISNEAVEIVKL